MRIATYNIWDGGTNAAGGNREKLLLRILRLMRPDILLLTEASHFTSADTESFRIWQNALGMRGGVIQASSGFHLALLARSPCSIRSMEAIHTQIFYHGCLSAIVDTPGGELRLLGVHLNPFDPGSRLSETRHLAREAYSDREVILLGDFNSVSPSDEIHESLWELPPRFLARHVRDADHPREFDTRAVAILEYAGFTDLYRKANPDDPGWTIPTDIGSPFNTTHMRLDYAFATPPLADRLSQVRVVDTEESRKASDHFPLVCEFKPGP